ncbi:MAG TPA: A/G-specific adenine glycosylase [Polyangia bacterium]|nr:A/G-specific adenine glycosylase [Polyangia bacterium]
MSPSVEDVTSLRAALIAWYRRHQRDLPWRRTRDPYAIWVSEIMLQQTRVETVTPRYERWLERFPTVQALAETPLDDVLAEWAGLGYYARARNLHAAAKEVAEHYGGELPDDPAAIRALPGVGRYTAGAILSLAFGRAEPVLDGNVTRVLSRLFRVEGDPRTAAVQERLWALAGSLVAEGQAGDVNQGLMELGATLCTPRSPACLVCPVVRFCGARQEGMVSAYPGGSRPVATRQVEQVSVALVRKGRVLLVRRPPYGLWGGLYELPSGEPVAGEDPAQAARRVAREQVGLEAEHWQPLDHFEHELTHRRIMFHGFHAIALHGAVRRNHYDAHVWLSPVQAATRGVSAATQRLLGALREAMNAPKAPKAKGTTGYRGGKEK